MNLKPCPFCWFPAELVNEYGKWIVKCSSELDCQGQVDISPSGLNGWESAELAIGGWNERAHEPRRTDASQGMSDSEMYARALLASAPNHFPFGHESNAASTKTSRWQSRNAKELIAELDRRAASREVAAVPSRPDDELCGNVQCSLGYRSHSTRECRT